MPNSLSMSVGSMFAGYVPSSFRQQYVSERQCQMDDASNREVQNDEFDFWLPPFYRCSLDDVHETGLLAGDTMAQHRKSRPGAEWSHTNATGFRYLSVSVMELSCRLCSVSGLYPHFLNKSLIVLQLRFSLIYLVRFQYIIVQPTQSEHEHPESHMAVGTGFGQLFRGLGISPIILTIDKHTYFFHKVKSAEQRYPQLCSSQSQIASFTRVSKHLTQMK